MTETPKCPYCGAEMELVDSFVSTETLQNKIAYRYSCEECKSLSPREITPDEALSAALHRAEPELRPLTLYELKNRCKSPLYAETLFLEFKSGWKSYRFWPRKPTPEQMAAEKWEE